MLWLRKLLYKWLDIGWQFEKLEKEVESLRKTVGSYEKTLKEAEKIIDEAKVSHVKIELLEEDLLESKDRVTTLEAVLATTNEKVKKLETKMRSYEQASKVAGEWLNRNPRLARGARIKQ